MSSDFKLNKTSELVSVSYSEEFINYEHIEDSATKLFEVLKNDVLIRRKKNEIHLHESLKHQLLTRLLEMKFYSDVNIFDTRRLIAVSSDCVSTIHILIRDCMHVNIYFRSSDYDGALPVDLEAISKLPKALIDHLKYFSDLVEYSEIKDNLTKLKNLKVMLNLSFGSLHRS